MLCIFSVSKLVPQRNVSSICRRPGNGGPQTCLPAAHGVAPPAVLYGPSSPANTQDPREGDDTRPPRERPHQAGSRGAERSRQGTPRKVSMTQAMTIGARRAPSGRQHAQCPRFLFGAKGASTGKESRGIRQRFPYRTTRPRPAGRQDGAHRGAQDGVTTRAFGRRRPPLVRIACSSCPPLNWPLWNPFPLNIWEEDQGLYK